MNTLLETLNTFLGFVAIMLVLSLFVTALVQFVQNALQLRAKNLRVGLQALLEKLLKEDNSKATAPGKNAKDIAQEVVTRAPFAPEEDANRLTKWVSPAVSWVDKDELLEHLKKSGVHVDEKKFSLWFERMEDYLSKRFVLNVRLITIVCAIIVACYFQISTPALLQRLSTDAPYRDLMAKAAKELADESPDLLRASTNYANVSAKAVEQLSAKYPNRVEDLKRVSWPGEARDDQVAELEAALKAFPVTERRQVIAEYRKLLTKLREEAVAASVTQREKLKSKLAKFDITPWPDGGAFFRSPSNIIGVLITAAFLSFGAPFWYGRLRELIQLRDALKPDEKTPEKKTPKPRDKQPP